MTDIPDIPSLLDWIEGRPPARVTVRGRPGEWFIHLDGNPVGNAIRCNQEVHQVHHWLKNALTNLEEGMLEYMAEQVIDAAAEDIGAKVIKPMPEEDEEDSHD